MRFCFFFGGSEVSSIVSWLAYPVRGRKLKTLQKYSIFKPVSDDNLELPKYEKQKKKLLSNKPHAYDLWNHEHRCK